MLLFYAGLLPLALAAPSAISYVHELKETFNAPAGWHPLGLPSPEHNIELQIGLHQPNFHVLEQHLYEVSDPDHVRYGQHLTKAQVDELVAPHDEALALVNEWLASYGVDENSIVRSSARDWIRVTLPVKMVEEMLDTTYQVWKHVDGDHLVRTTSYSLPDYLHPHIDVVQPTTLFGRWKKQHSNVIIEDDQSLAGKTSTLAQNLQNAIVDPACNTSITINCLLALYNATGFTPSAPGNSIGITGYLEQYANDADLQSFYADQVPQAVNSSFEVISVKGGINSQNISEAGVEANLDVQFAFGLTHPIPGTFYSTAGRPPIVQAPGDTSENTNEPYNDWIDFVLAQEDPPKVISTSYGESEQSVPFSYAERACRGFAQLVPIEYAQRVCKGFAQLGARGVSVIMSSGDGGPGAGGPAKQCVSNDGKSTPKFIPVFPASCPYVTSVGGTYRIPEIGIEFSGGGFSDYFPRPGYQDKVAESFLKTLPNGTYAGLYNRTGRGIPDVSAQSYNFRIYKGGRPVLIGGTSASAPAFAGFVALLNDVRLSAGRQSLGFLNPWLYLVGHKGFKDITAGHAPGCGTPGFNATVGWDPVTGLGTPDFGKLKDLVMACGHVD